jgi:hypothetical protein
LDLPLGTQGSASAPEQHHHLATEGGEPALVQRVVDVSPPEPREATDTDPDGMSDSTAAQPETVQPAAPRPAAAGSSTDLDELARKLYDPLMTRLRADLLVERERRGLRTDVW